MKMTDVVFEVHLITVTTEREARVKMLGEAFSALLAGRPPSRDAALFLGGAGMAWLENGGSLERDYFKVTKPKSHRTPAFIWQQMNAHQDESQEQK
jgi:hypothetical protein